MRIPAVLSTLVLSAALLAGCGGGDGGGGGVGADRGKEGDKPSATDGYCDEIRAAAADFLALQAADPDFSEFGDAISTFHELADAAPSDVSDEWKTLDTAFTSLEETLESVGLSLEDLGAITAGDLPDGLSSEDLVDALPKLETVFESLDDDKVSTASDAIEKHAKSECGVDLAKS
jgi:hypothetical protein